MTALIAGACGAAGPTVGDGSVAPSSTDGGPVGPRPSTASGQCRGWAISLASTGVHGADTPEDAANSTRFGLPPGYDFPSTNWTTASSLPPIIWLSQERGSLEVSQMPDGSWYVTAGNYCG